jgi:hypothetical protein
LNVLVVPAHLNATENGMVSLHTQRHHYRATTFDGLWQQALARRDEGVPSTTGAACIVPRTAV